jgi:hypothetical protein
MKGRRQTNGRRAQTRVAGQIHKTDGHEINRIDGFDYHRGEVSAAKNSRSKVVQSGRSEE